MNIKKATGFLIVSILGGVITLGSYILFIEKEEKPLSFLELHPKESEHPKETETNLVRTGFNETTSENTTQLTEAADKTVHAVVHVKNMSVGRQPRNFFEYLHGGGIKKEYLRGAGSGVIVTPDGYIVTNNHVIKGASAIQVTLNNNKTYTAEIVGADVKADIALLKIDAENLQYIPFGNSNNIKIGQWVLAVGNPFNLTSTVTAGIISAKARDLNPHDNHFQSFIQTDAAINSGNSGGALVNTQGQLVGINTAITSQTGSYIGYSFAVPSNTVRKIVEDILEYGNVREAVLGVRGTVMNGSLAENLDLNIAQGFYIAEVDAKSGAQKAGLKKGDVIIKIDRSRITKFADLTGYLNTKHPNETVKVTYLRDGEQHETNVELIEYESFAIRSIGLEVTNASADELAKFQVKNGVKISRALNQTMEAENLAGIIITKINQQKVHNVDDVKEVIENANPNTPLSVTFATPNGAGKTFVFR